MDIYQEIWNADMAGNGIKPVLKEKDGNKEEGYVVVNELREGTNDTKLFTKVVIPQHKLHTYELCTRLFNNYCLSPTQHEINTLEEDTEVHELVASIIDTKPMRIVQKWISDRTGQFLSDYAFYNLLMKIWFTQYTQSSGKDLSAFEHVIVGEQKRGKVSGYHFWYKYYLDDSNELLDKDTIDYKGLAGSNINQNILVPEVSTLSYSWDAYDYDNHAYRPLFKKIGGFFNGCSIEGLMALGTVRFMNGAPKEAVINGSLYEMKLYRSSNAQYMRTFYPVFKKMLNVTDIPAEDPTPIVVVHDEPLRSNIRSVKIIAALVNPPNGDEGKEVVTLFNPTPTPVNIKDWRIVDRNTNFMKIIEERSIEPGDSISILLKSGKNGEIDHPRPE